LIERQPIATPSDPDRAAIQQKAAEQNPVSLYLNRLAPASRRTQREALDRIAGLLTGGPTAAADAPWHLMDAHSAQSIRTSLANTYAPTTTNRMLAALRGVLREAWGAGLMDAESYHRAAAVEPVAWSKPPLGRCLTGEEIRSLFEICSRDATPAGARDAALLTVLYGGGLRRSEVVALDVRDYDAVSGTLTVRSTKRSRERSVYATDGAAQALERWIELRGNDAGPLFVPVTKGQKILVRDRRMSEQSIAKVLVKRGKQANVPAFSCQDLRRSFITELLEAGVDIVTVQRLAGHCSVTTTQAYDRRSSAARRVLARMLPVPVPS
jgi:integrase